MKPDFKVSGVFRNTFMVYLFKTNYSKIKLSVNKYIPLSGTNKNSIIQYAVSLPVCSVSPLFSIFSFLLICIFGYYAKKFNKAVFDYNIAPVGGNWYNDPFPDGNRIIVRRW
jgi:hypothetical protein